MILSFCGNDCTACPRFTATATGDPTQLAEVAELWHRLGWRDRVVSGEEIACRGCPPSHPCRHGIAECAAERGVKTCRECGEKVTCARLDAALAHTELAADACRKTCDSVTYACLEKAFFRKRENLG